MPPETDETNLLTVRCSICLRLHPKHPEKGASQTYHRDYVQGNTDYAVVCNTHDYASISHTQHGGTSK